MKNQIVVISDVHIGTNYLTCWYQKDVHEPYLIKVLDWIIENSANIKEFVILGDLFDFWTYPPDIAPPTIDMILQANPNIFGADGKLSQVLTALEGHVSYLCGNHDMNVTQADLNKIPNPHYTVQKADDVYALAEGWLTTFTHGHLTTMFNAPDTFNTRFDGLPLGHFVTRAVAYRVRNILKDKPGQTAADLPDQGSPYGFDLSSFLLTPINLIDPSIARIFIEYIIQVTGIPPTEPVLLANSQPITMRDAGAYYSNLWPQWVKQYGDLYAYKALWADKDGSYMGWFAQKRALETNTELVVMGHTHAPKRGLPQGSLVSYINSGFECVSKPDFGKQAFTFAVITQSLDQVSAPAFELFQVVKNGDSYAIESDTAGPDWIASPNTLGDFSCYVIVRNNSGGVATRDSFEAFHGNYVVAPPESIPDGHWGRCWLQDYLGGYGSQGTVTYKIEGGPRSGSLVRLNFECPTIAITGPLPNSCSGSPFITKSGAADWGPRNVIATDGHPFFIEFNLEKTVTTPTREFTGQCGQNSSATSPIGLQPNEMVSLNGNTDLSTCIQANDGGCVYGITLTGSPGIYDYVVNVDARGPKGFGSGSMYLAFTDESGDTYRLFIYSSSRSVHTVRYNSSKPAIIKIQWSNTPI